jgi:hypothetical protein
MYIYTAEEGEALVSLWVEVRVETDGHGGFQHRERLPRQHRFIHYLKRKLSKASMRMRDLYILNDKQHDASFTTTAPEQRTMSHGNVM